MNIPHKLSPCIKVVIYAVIHIYCASCSIAFAQSTPDSLKTIWEDKSLSKVVRANAYIELINENYIESKTDSALIMANELKTFTLKNSLELEYAKVINTLGQIELYLGNAKEATANFENSLKFFKKLNYPIGEASALNSIGSIYKQNWELDESLDYYNESLKISKQINDTTSIIMNLINIGNVYNTRYQPDKAMSYYTESLRLSQAIDDKRNEALTYINIGYNFTIRKDFDNAVRYLNKSIELSTATGNTLLHASALKNLAQCYFVQKKYDKVIEYSKACLKLSELISNQPFQKDSYYFLYEAYKGKNDYEKAIEYNEKLNSLDIALNELAASKQLQRMQISKIRMKDSLLQQQESIKENLIHESELQQKTSERNYLILGFVLVLILISIVGFFIYKNNKRNQLLKQQKTELALSQKDRLFKDLELKAIDAMILGQEKERQRMAYDLHDSVGASLSAAKMQFNYLLTEKGNREQSDQLIKKISTLLEDAYVEVRSMAHLKNSGVMSKSGLLPAIKNLTENVSDSENLQIVFHSHGMEHRLENSLEVSIFRIIQELVTNIIKHAEASEAAIHITNHLESLNIMVEDNGKGFDQYHISTEREGMGISSIDKRVEHLNGNMTIESQAKKGTTIIIDIPL